MKRWGAPRTIGSALAGVALVLVGTVVWLLNKPPTVDCAAEAPTDRKAHEIRATQVVVQPWLGKHHVYGIFLVPSRYRHNRKYIVTTSVRGFGHAWAIGERFDGQHVDDPVAGPGHSLLRSYVPTRVAVWFLFNGLFGDLRRPCNWTLVFVERSS